MPFSYAYASLLVVDFTLQQPAKAEPQLRPEDAWPKASIVLLTAVETSSRRVSYFWHESLFR